MRNQVLTNLFQSIIEKMGLVRTGRLLRSVQVDAQMVDDTLIVDVTCEDYVKFLNDDYNLLGQFVSSNVFSNEVSSLFAPWLESRVSEILAGSPQSIDDPSVIVLLNGV